MILLVETLASRAAAAGRKRGDGGGIVAAAAACVLCGEHRAARSQLVALWGILCILDGL